jgi:small subunit ribosomal protein S8
MANEKTVKKVEIKEKKVKEVKTPQTKFGVVNFPVGDFLIQIKNAAMAKNKTITVKTNKQITAIADALKKLGILDEVKKEEGTLTLSLTFKNKRALITNIKLVSKPGLRIYMGVDEIADRKGPSTYLISSPKGIITSKEAKKLRTGGEVIAEIL